MVGFIRHLTRRICGLVLRWRSNSGEVQDPNPHRWARQRKFASAASAFEPSVLALGFIVAASFGASVCQAQNLPATGPLRVCASNPRYFTDGSGKPIYLTAAHTWTNLPDIGLTDPPAAFDFNGYLRFLAEHNYNYIRLWRWETPKDIEGDGITRYSSPHPWKRTGPGTAWDVKPKFDLNAFDEEYFARMRKRVEAARDHGIYVSIMLFDGWELQFSNWTGHPFNGNNNINGIDGDADRDGRGKEIESWPLPAGVETIEKAYVRKVIDTVNDLDNVLYEISNESGPYSTDWQYEMIEYVKSYEAGKPKQHPVGMSFQYPGGSNTTLFNSPADWISPNPDSRTGVYNYKDNPPPGDGRKVILSDTDHLWGNGGDRQWAWKSFLRGLNPLYMDPYLDPPIWECLLPNVEEVRRNLGYTRTYANKVDLALMTPRPELTSTAYCLANPGSEYLVYQPGMGEFTLDLTAGTYSYEWFNPVAGSIASTGSLVAKGGPKSFSSPFNGDAILYLKRGSPSKP